MRDGCWCQVGLQGEIEYLDWEYMELRAALHRKRFAGRSMAANLDENMEGIIACFALAIREQILHSKIPGGNDEGSWPRDENRTQKPSDPGPSRR